MDIKIVFGDPKTGKSIQREYKDEQARALHDLKIGDTIKGEFLDLPGYEFVLTGGSDYAGFPMRRDVPGTMRKRILAVHGVGVSNKKKARGKDKKYMRRMDGMRKRTSVAGNAVYERTTQLNVKVVREGSVTLFPLEKKQEKSAVAEAGAS